MAGKASLLHYFKPKPTPAPIVVVEVEETSPVNNGPIEVADEDESSRSNGDAEVPDTEGSPITNEDAEVKPVESDDDEEEIRPVRRSTRASASNARKAWNYNEDNSSSSDDDCDFKRGTRKRGRPSGGSGGRQATLSKNGTLITKKEKETNKSIKSKKKKVKLDPEREAFLRSGVPDVIEKAKKKSMENGNKNKNSGSDEEVTIIQETKRKQLDPETLAFLHSGVPDSVLKAQQSVDKRKEQDDFLVNMGFFPKTSHVYNNDVDEEGEESSGNEPSVNFHISAEKPEESPNIFLRISPETSSESQDFNCLSSQESGICTPVGLCCGENPIRLSSPKNLNVKTRFRHSDSKKKQEKEKSQNNDMRPWIDQMRVTSVKNLVVDKNALETFTRWLKQWKSDIKDDGGTSRKQEQKKKRGNSSDSDFVTSDEGESEMKKKSVLLTGPNGCGKTATVYVLAKHYDFQVVEVNFSTRRPGKEVLQRVEEAVLSHHLKSSHNCLVLFKDIDLLHPEEDEGFCSAVAQLITTAVRPIVMTSSLPSQYLIDSKLDRKDPLRISFTLPKASEIVEKILKPILTSTKSILESADSQLDQWLDSIVRHSGCDIRQCINQLQLLLSTSADITRLSNQDIHLHSNPFQTHLVDLNFPRQSLLPNSSKTKEDSQLGGGDEDDEDELNLTLSARKKRCITQLDSLSDCLELFGDLDGISRISSSRPTRNVNIFGDMEEANWHWNHMSGMRSTFFTRLEMCLEAQKRKEDCVATKLNPKWMRELVLESDEEIDKWSEIGRVDEEIGQYCDRSTTGGIDWESCAAVRTIVKNNVLDGAAGRVQKRHGRMASYFNRLDKRLVGKIQGTLGFQEQLDSVKLYS